VGHATGAGFAAEAAALFAQVRCGVRDRASSRRAPR
jgi:hypothetical protein